MTLLILLLQCHIVGLTHFISPKDLAFYKCFANTCRTIMFVDDQCNELLLAESDGFSCQSAFWSTLGWFSMWQFDIDMAISGLLLLNLSLSLQVRYGCSMELEVFPLQRRKCLCVPTTGGYICHIHCTCNILTLYHMITPRNTQCRAHHTLQETNKKSLVNILVLKNKSWIETLVKN